MQRLRRGVSWRPVQRLEGSSTGVAGNFVERQFEFAIAKTTQISVLLSPELSWMCPHGSRTTFGANAHLLQERVSRTRDPNHRLGGAGAAQRAALDRPWIGLGPCTKRRRLDVTLRQHGAILDHAGPNGAQISHMCRNNFALSLILRGGHTMHITGHSRPFAPLVALRFGHCAFGAA